jgi:hypothetical protein
LLRRPTRALLSLVYLREEPGNAYADLSEEDHIDALGRALAILIGPQPTLRDRLALSIAMQALREAIEEEVLEYWPERVGVAPAPGALAARGPDRGGGVIKRKFWHQCRVLHHSLPYQTILRIALGASIYHTRVAQEYSRGAFRMRLR